MYITARDLNTVVYPGTRGSRSIRRPKLGAQGRRDTRRIVGAASAAKTLSARHGRSAAAMCCVRLGNVCTHGVRVWREVAQEP